MEIIFIARLSSLIAFTVYVKKKEIHLLVIMSNKYLAILNKKQRKLKKQYKKTVK